MPIELAGIHLERIHKITTLEQADFVKHRIPGLEGNVLQSLGRESVRLQIEGIFYNSTAKEDMESLRDVYKEKEPVDFLAEIVGQAYFGQVVLEQFEVFQIAQEPDQFSYILTVAEYVEPPEPEGLPGFSDVDAAILDEAQSFMDIATLPDLIGSIPSLSDPTKPLLGVLDGVRSALEGLNGEMPVLNDLFGEGE